MAFLKSPNKIQCPLSHFCSKKSAGSWNHKTRLSWSYEALWHECRSHRGPRAGQGTASQPGLCSCLQVTLAKLLPSVRGFAFSGLTSGLMLCGVVCDPPVAPSSQPLANGWVLIFSCTSAHTAPLPSRWSSASPESVPSLNSAGLVLAAATRTAGYLGRSGQCLGHCSLRYGQGLGRGRRRRKTLSLESSVCPSASCHDWAS